MFIEGEGVHFVLFGTYYGYSKESILKFLHRVYTDDFLSPIPFPFDGTGFVPSDYETKMNPDDVVANINSRRFDPEPYGLYHVENDVEFDDLMELIETNFEFCDRVTENIFYIMEQDEFFSRLWRTVSNDSAMATAV